MAEEFNEQIRALMPNKLAELEKLFAVAEEFVRVHYSCRDQGDRNIKVLATINQLIELKKMAETESTAKMMAELYLEMFKSAREQKGQ